MTESHPLSDDRLTCENCGARYTPLWDNYDPQWCTACVFSAEDEDDDQ